jgi:hypothetical protein
MFSIINPLYEGKTNKKKSFCFGSDQKFIVVQLFLLGTSGLYEISIIIFLLLLLLLLLFFMMLLEYSRFVQWWGSK